MATIPIHDIPQAPRSGGGPVLQPQKRIQIDPSGVFAAQRQAAIQPLMPEDMFAGDVKAQAAWGEAMQTLGKTLGVISENMARVKYRKDVMTADADMETATSEYIANLARNPDPDTWVTGYDATVPGMEKRIFEGKRYSRQAEDEIRLRFRLHTAQTRTNIATRAISESVQQARQLYQVRDDQMPREDTQGRIALVRTQQGDGLMSQSEAAAKEWEIEQQARDFRLKSFIETDPKGAAEMLRTGGGAEFSLNDVTRAEYLRMAETRVAQQEASSVEFFNDRVAEGHKPEEVLATIQDKLTPATLAEMRQRVTVGRNMNDPVQYEKWYRIVSNYSAKEDESGQNHAILRTEIGVAFDGEKAAELRSKLEEQAKRTTPADATDLSFDSALSELNTSLESGDFGSWKRVYDGSNIYWDKNAGTSGAWMRKRDAWEGDGAEPIKIDPVTAQRLTAKTLKPGAVVDDLNAKAAAARRASMMRTLLEKRKKEGKYETPAAMIDDFRTLLADPAKDAAQKALDGEVQSPASAAQPRTQLLDELYKRHGITIPLGY